MSHLKDEWKEGDSRRVFSCRNYVVSIERGIYNAWHVKVKKKNTYKPVLPTRVLSRDKWSTWEAVIEEAKVWVEESLILTNMELIAIAAKEEKEENRV